MNSKILMIRVEDICVLDHQVWKSMPILSLVIKSRSKAKTCLIDLTRVLSKALIKLNQIGNCLSHQVLPSYLMRVLQDQGKNDTGRLFSFFDKLRSTILNNLKANQGKRIASPFSYLVVNCLSREFFQEIDYLLAVNFMITKLLYSKKYHTESFNQLNME